ncbi:MAG TPA: PAS domain S-box protein [bacterium]|nr:PAS domain S-box protein [bacterium]
MNDIKKTKAQLLEELQQLRRRVAELEKGEKSRRQTENELRDSKEKLARNVAELNGIINALPGLVTVVDTEFNVLVANNEVYRKFGQQGLHEVLGRKCHQTRKGLDDPCPQCNLVVAFKTGQMESRVSTPDEEKLMGIATKAFAIPLKNEQGTLWGGVEIIMDISDIRKTEKDLRLIKERMQLALEGANLGTWDWNVVTGEVSFNKQWAEMLGYDLEEIEPRLSSWENLVHPDDFQYAMEQINANFAGKTPSYEAEYRLRAKDGTWKWIYDSGKVLERDPDGKPIRMTGVHLDITERKAAEDALRASEIKFRGMAENLADALFITDADGFIIYMSPSTRQVFGWSPDEMIGRTFTDFLPEDQIEYALTEFQNCVSSGKRVANIQLVMKRADGSQFHGELSSSLLMNGDNMRGTLGQIRDITERIKAAEEKSKLEDQLHQAQKMEAVGRLAGGVAHDFNNILTGINGYAEMILSGLEPGDPLRVDMLEIKTAGERAAALTAQLLTFSRKQVIDPKVVRPNEILELSQKMLRRIIGEDVELKFMPARNLGRIKADPSQIDQILVNLAVNARDAMPNGGKLIIETQNVTIDETFCAAHLDAEPGEYVMLTVSDTGCGMDEQTRLNIFEPFFSTKDKEKGTGLGLATVYGIIKQNNGFISVYSEPNVGSTFKVYFPRVQDEAVTLTREKGARLPKGTETILLVEDEAMVRGLVRKILGQQGYKVIEAESVESAIKIFAETDEPIDLLLTDVIMPVMNGRELHNYLAAKRPGLKALFMSGYTENIVAHHGVLDDGVSFIQKPFTIETIARMVRRVLDGE